jgi:hypothetical protein
LEAAEALLHCVEVLSYRPPCVPVDVLWYFNDCAKDKKYREILTKSNRSHPRMSIVICCIDGTNVSYNEYKDMQDYAGTVIGKLLNSISPDPCIINTKMPTKTLIMSLFHNKFHQAILELKAKKKEHHLCVAH